MVRITASRRTLALVLFVVLAWVPPAGAVDPPAAPPAPAAPGDQPEAAVATAESGVGDHLESLLCGLLGGICRLFEDDDGDEGASMDPFG